MFQGYIWKVLQVERVFSHLSKSYYARSLVPILQLQAICEHFFSPETPHPINGPGVKYGLTKLSPWDHKRPSRLARLILDSKSRPLHCTFAALL